MKWVTRVPTHFNDGSAIPIETLDEVFHRIAREFGGCSIDGPGRGIWMDSDGKVYDEPSFVVSVLCEADQIDTAKAIVMEIGKMLDQKAMYFEAMSGTTEIIPTE